jgi:hypothetical protein
MNKYMYCKYPLKRTKLSTGLAVALETAMLIDPESTKNTNELWKFCEKFCRQFEHTPSN